MTMTDTEAKALALALLNTARDSRGLPAATMEDADGISWFEAICRAIEREAAIEARHAAELRELKERFSEVAAKADKVLASHDYYPDGSIRHALAPFILPAPDPLVEVFDECFEQGMKEGETWSESMARKARTALASRGGKIVWEAGE